jgi:hypothetical protein
MSEGLSVIIAGALAETNTTISGCTDDFKMLMLGIILSKHPCIPSTAGVRSTLFFDRHDCGLPLRERAALTSVSDLNDVGAKCC